MLVALCCFSVFAQERATSTTEKPLPPNAPVLHVTYEYPEWSLPFLVAMEMHFFSERGLNIKPKKVGTGNPPLNFTSTDVINGHSFSLMTKQWSSPAIMRFVHPFLYKKDGPIVEGFLVKRKAGINKWSDFKGREKMQIAFGSMADFALIGKILKAEGADEKSYEGALGGDPVKTFEENDNIVGICGWGNQIQDLLKKNPNEYVLLGKNLRPEFISDPYYVACTYINTKSSNTKPNVVKSYTEAIDQAIDHIRNNPEHVLAVVPKYFDFTTEQAGKLTVYDFTKSTEPIDLESFRKSTNADFQKFLYEPK
jgi:ABC-type nitrate/sulfonate/bicarbonate transport system substrate-binding protein